MKFFTVVVVLLALVCKSSTKAVRENDAFFKSLEKADEEISSVKNLPAVDVRHPDQEVRKTLTDAMFSSMKAKNTDYVVA